MKAASAQPSARMLSYVLVSMLIGGLSAFVFFALIGRPVAALLVYVFVGAASLCALAVQRAGTAVFRQ